MTHHASGVALAVPGTGEARAANRGRDESGEVLIRPGRHRIVLVRVRRGSVETRLLFARGGHPTVAVLEVGDRANDADVVAGLDAAIERHARDPGTPLIVYRVDGT